ncbi:MAG: ABC transporter ATP-binding protein [Candidatus Acidiferrales bacterium]
MSQPVILVNNLSKRYRIGERERYSALRDVLARPFSSLSRRKEGQKRADLWALKDLSFEVREGEVLGLIGRNGAGKSTLLKILSRITKPTEGSAEIRGRVGSLLEVGTGFHPELTGRENVFLNGAILGMSKREIERKFDEIVAFAEVERFLDTPLKYYSSGMQVRLAFAVAAHLEPEILLIDEVLAVGDIQFQKKCLGKMGDVARQGRTVIFVSHNMAAVNALCLRCIVMKQGSKEFDGTPANATAWHYQDAIASAGGNGDLLTRPRREGNGKGRFCSVAAQPLSSSGRPLDLVYPGCDFRIETEVKCLSDFVDCNLAIIIWDVNSYRVIDVNTAQKGRFLSLRSGQRARAEFVLRQVLLKPGNYFVSLWLGRWPTEIVDHVDAFTLNVVESEETSQHSEIFPGVYLCRFDSDLVIQ